MTAWARVTLHGHRGSQTVVCKGGRSSLGISSGRPAGKRPVPAIVWWLEEHCLPELVVAVVARDPDVSHTAAAPGRFPGRLADARRPAYLRLAWPQMMTKWAALWLVLEQRNAHLDDHAVNSSYESIISAAGSGPGPGGGRPGRGCPQRMRRPRWRRPHRATRARALPNHASNGSRRAPLRSAASGVSAGSASKARRRTPGEHAQ